MDFQFIYSEISHKGNIRQENEDSCQIVETLNGTLFVVCDGMGGAVGGKKASSIAVASIVEFFNKEHYENLQIALYKSLTFANEQIYATSQMYPDFKGMGTTACVVLVQKSIIYFAHVGDSRIYLFSNKTLFQLTKDHSFVNQLIDQGTITVEESITHHNKNRILRALGVHQKVETTVSSQPLLLKKEDILLICSDGLNDMVTDIEITNLIDKEEPLEKKTNSLLTSALENGGKDNITIQALEILESPHKKTDFVDKTLYTENKKPITTIVEVDQKKKRNKMVAFILIPLFLLGLFLIINNKEEKVVTQSNEEENGIENNNLIESNNIPSDTKPLQPLEDIKEEVKKTDREPTKEAKETEKKIEIKKSIEIDSSKVKKKPINTENISNNIANYKYDYFIIGKETDTSKNRYTNYFTFISETKNNDKGTSDLITQINNGKRREDLKIGDTVYLSKEAFDKNNIIKSEKN